MQAQQVAAQAAARVFIICDQSDTAPLWGYMLREKGLLVTLETQSARALEELPPGGCELTIIDVDIPEQERIALCQHFRELSASPLLMLLPTHHETHILEAYAAGVDDVMIKPISPAILMAKILAWMRRGWAQPVEGMMAVRAGRHSLDPGRRCAVDPEGRVISLTGLEFRLLHLLMSRPGNVFKAEDIIRLIWGGFGHGDEALLKNVVYRLRRKIEPEPGHPRLLQTWPGGYSFQG